MRIRLTPQANVFYDMFTASANNVLDGAHTLHALITGPLEDREALNKELRDAEHRGDDRTHNILREVNSTFVTPIDREDIEDVVAETDRFVVVRKHPEEAVIARETDPRSVNS